MRKQTKLVAVLSTAALLAIGASMTSFAATGWAEEDGTWVYYNRDGERATDKWAKSGNNWYFLDSDGEMAVDTLVEDDSNYYYVDINGVMASNKWVAIDNEDAGEDDEPEQHWYYFQANGKALTNGDNSAVSLKTVNGKKYAFDEDGKMLYGWVDKDAIERVDNTDGEGFTRGDYYFGGENDGAMTVGWLLTDITYTDIDDSNTYSAIAPAFTDDEDQTRYFYFLPNGKKVKSEDENGVKERTINGKKYGFDINGAMVAEWSVDIAKASDSGVKIIASKSEGGAAVTAKYAQQWRYFNSVEDGAKVSNDWFKVVSAEYLNDGKYDDDEEAWYFADGSGDVYAGEFKTIKGKKYAFGNDGRMIEGLKFIKDDDNDGLIVCANDDEANAFDTEEDFREKAANYYEPNGFSCYYFGEGEDGAMKTNKTNVEIDGDNYNFYFENSGSRKGRGVTGEKDDKYYQSGMLLKSGTDEKYQVIQRYEAKDEIDSYWRHADVESFLKELAGLNIKVDSYDSDNMAAGVEAADKVADAFNKKAEDLSELYVINYDKAEDSSESIKANASDFVLVNTSGKVIDSRSKNKDGNNYYYCVNKGGKIAAIYVED